LARPARDGKTVIAYGNQIRYDGAIGFHRDAPRPVPYVFPAGTVPLDQLDAHTAASLPYLLPAGQTLRVAVVARPGAIGERLAALRLEAELVNNPALRVSATAALRVDGDTGALPALWPPYAAWGAVGRMGATRHLLLTNDGDRPLERRAIRTSGTGFSVVAGSAATQTINPGESETFALRYVPPCPLPWGNVQGAVTVETSEGTLRTTLGALADCAQ
jgi:hypothetical protein